MRDQGDDTLLWREFDQMVKAEPLVGELAAAVICLAIDLFEPPVPQSLQKHIEDLQPTVRVWLQEYAPGWLFEKFPRYEICFFSRSKRSMFLRELYCVPRANHGNQFFAVLFPFQGMKRQVQKQHVQVTAMRAIAHKTRWLALHLIYHAGATLRYMWELPRWRYRMQLLRAHGEVRNPSNSSS